MGSEPTQGDDWDGCMVFWYHDRIQIAILFCRRLLKHQWNVNQTFAVVSLGFTMFVSFPLPQNHTSVRTGPCFLIFRQPTLTMSARSSGVDDALAPRAGLEFVAGSIH